ncbi:MAG: hypothetical protein OEU94_04420 [Aquincola sp.]|nr:hypothetical protein [Aquincola sp.]MDH4289128.1 hypothetical protein [Aquincola sp.]MDH5330466.1 hypothetical protein [Aquincola sp.]
MTRQRSIAVARPIATDAPDLDLGAANAVIEAMLRTYTEQWQAMLAWQHAMADWQQDLWDQWISHWGGGVPIDA